jgi:hypothetical protein
MADMAIASANTSGFRQLEFYLFSVAAFVGKSMLLIRLPYREWPVNTLYTGVLLLFFYCYFRFRQNISAPPLVIFCLAMAVGVDVLGNFFGLYNHRFGPLKDFDEFAHMTGSGFSAVAVIWLLRASTRRMGFRLPQAMLTFFGVTVTFSYCAWYEILELWDELFYGDFQRIWTLHDTANDLQWDLAGVVVFALATALYFKLTDRAGQVYSPAV